MHQDTQKNSTTLIVVALIGVVGTIVAAIIVANSNYKIEKLRQESELTRIALVSIATQGGTTQVSMASTISATTNTPFPINELQPTDTPYPTYTAAPSLTTPTIQPSQNVQDLNLIHGEPISPETLAKTVGGNAAYWTQAGSYVWVYSNKGHNTLMRHPGDNMILTYWKGFGNPQNADGCQIIISPVNSLEKWVKCPPGTNAQIMADQVGLHLTDDTGYFP